MDTSMNLDRKRWPLRRASGPAAEAFTLIEVVMAIGITAFAAFAIAGLIPVGLSNFRQTKNLSTAAEISRQVFSEIQVTPFSKLVTPPGSGSQTPGNNNPAFRFAPPTQDVNSGSGSSASTNNNSTNTRFFDEQGDEVPAYNYPGDALGIYQVNVCVLPQTPFVQSTANAGTNANSDLATVLVQVAYNPGNLPLDLDTSGDQWNQAKWTGGSNNMPNLVQIYNFQTMLAGIPSGY